MKKKTNIKTVIRQIVREEVAMAINEVITELKQPSLSSPVKSAQPKSKKKIVEKKSFTKNSVLNDILNETAQSDEWKTMGDGTYDSNKINDVMSSQYGDMMTSSNKINADAMIASMGEDPSTVSDGIKDIFTKDYRTLMKAIDKKKVK